MEYQADMNQMSKKTDLWIKRLAICFCTLSGVFIPVTSNLNGFIPLASRIFLLTVLLTIFFGGLYIIRSKEVINVLKACGLYSLFFLSILLISAVKYIVELSQGKETTFFMAFAIPIYALYAIVLFAMMKAYKPLFVRVLTGYCASFCVLFLLFQNYFVEANGVFRAAGMFFGSNELGLYAALCLFCALILLVKDSNYRIVNCLFAGISGAALLLSGSRGSLLGTVLGLFLFALFSIRNFLKANKKEVLCLILAVIALTASFTAIFLPSESDKLNSTRYDSLGYSYIDSTDIQQAENGAEDDESGSQESEQGKETQEEDQMQESDSEQSDQSGEIDDLINQGKDKSFSDLIDRLLYGDSESSSYKNNLRLNIWAEYIKVIADHLAFGTSFDQAMRPEIGNIVRDPHNTVLFIGFRYGIIPMALYLIMFITIAVKAIFKKKKTSNYIVVLAMFAAIICISMVNDLMDTGALWVAFALTFTVYIQSGETPVHCGKKKILILRNYHGNGGIEKQIVNITSGLKEHGYEVYLFTDHPSPFSQAMESISAKVHVSKAKATLLRGLEIYRFCKNNAIGLIQSHMWKESFYGRIARFLNRDVVHVYRVHTYIDCGRISEKKKKLYHLLDQLTSSWVDCYLSINAFNIKELKERSHINERKLFVVHDGISQLRDVQSEESSQRINREQIAMIANFEQGKGHDILIQGMQLLDEDGYRIKAYIFGGVPGEGTPWEDNTVRKQMEELRKNCHVQDQIEFCGRVEDVGKALDGISIVVLPSYAEGTPNCLLEAMSVRKIVVASNVGGIPEFIEDGVNGFLHEAGSPRAFADKLEEVLKLDNEHLKNILQAGQQTWRTQYHIDALIEGLLSIYSDWDGKLLGGEHE